MLALSIVMPCHDRAHDLRRVLEAYDRQTSDDFELIAVDDASRDATPDVLARHRPRRYPLRVERLARNAGPATARNRGLELARGALVLFVGDDILPDAGLVAGHLAAHAAAPDAEVAVLGRVEWPADMPRNSLMRHVDGPGAQQFSYAHFADGQEYDYRHLYTANVSLKRRFLHDSGMRFDTEFPYAAFEDAELAFRLSARGLRIRYAAAPVGYHYHYHTVWSFARRQYQCGRMAHVFAGKHPALAHDLRVTKTRLLGLLAAAHLPDRAWQPGRPWAAWVEEHALRLANHHEWTSHALVDDLYVQVLDYFWQAGLIDGVFGGGALARRVRDAYAAAHLASQLADDIDRARAEGLSLPWPDAGPVQAALRAARPRALRSALVGRTAPALARQAYERWRAASTPLSDRSNRPPMRRVLATARRWWRGEPAPAPGDSAEARALPGIHGRVHRADLMLGGTTPEQLAVYTRIGVSAYQLIADALQLAGRRPADVTRLLDYGCGYGRVLRAIVQHVDPRRIDVFDVDPAAVRFCAAEFGVTGLSFGRPWDFGSIPFGRYDCIWAGSVFTHLSADFTREMLAQLGGLLAPGGVLVFTTHGDEALRRAETGFFEPRITALSGRIGAEYAARGFCFVPYEDADFAMLPFDFARRADFGMTWMSESTIAGLLDEVGGGTLRLLRFIPAGWEGVQDTVIVHRAPTGA